MQKKLSPTLARVLVYVLLFLVIGLILFFSLKSILPGFLEIIEHGNQAEIEDYLRSFAGPRGMVLAFLLQFLQIVSVVFPGGPIQIAVGIVFGAIPGFLICHFGYVLSSFAVFYAVRKLGRRINALLPKNPKDGGRLGVITRSRHPASMVFLCSVLPFMPNGLVPYVAARTKIASGQYFLAVYFGSMPALLFLCTLGSGILNGNFVIVGILVGFVVLTALLFLLARKRSGDWLELFRSRVLSKIEEDAPAGPIEEGAREETDAAGGEGADAARPAVPRGMQDLQEGGAE